MIIDTSALVSILDQEQEAERLAHAIATASERMLSAANLVETGIVMQVRRGDEAVRDLDLLLAKLKIEIIAVSVKQANLARKAFQRFGRGRHPARLNFGDCFAYALAKDSGAPLLFKGEDFRRRTLLWRTTDTGCGNSPQMMHEHQNQKAYISAYHILIQSSCQLYRFLIHKPA